MKKVSEQVGKALNYVRKNMDKAEIDYVLGMMEKNRCSAKMVDGTFDTVQELMNDYASENDLPEYFWESELDEDELMYALHVEEKTVYVLPDKDTPQGNAFWILGFVTELMEKHGMGEYVDAYNKLTMGGDYRFLRSISQAIINHINRKNE